MGTSSGAPVPKFPPFARKQCERSRNVVKIFVLEVLIFKPSAMASSAIRYRVRCTAERSHDSIVVRELDVSDLTVVSNLHTSKIADDNTHYGVGEQKR